VGYGGGYSVGLISQRVPSSNRVIEDSRAKEDILSSLRRFAAAFAFVAVIGAVAPAASMATSVVVSADVVPNHQVNSVAGTVDCQGNFSILAHGDVYNPVTFTIKLGGTIVYGPALQGTDTSMRDLPFSGPVTGTGATVGESIQASTSDGSQTSGVLVLTGGPCTPPCPECLQPISIVYDSGSKVCDTQYAGSPCFGPPNTGLNPGDNTTLTVTFEQDGNEVSNATVTLSWNGDLTFVSNGDGSAVCVTGSHSVTCTYTDFAHQYKSDSYSFTVGNNAPGAVVTTDISVATQGSTEDCGTASAQATITMADPKLTLVGYTCSGTVTINVNQDAISAGWLFAITDVPVVHAQVFGQNPAFVVGDNVLPITLSPGNYRWAVVKDNELVGEWTYFTISACSSSSPVSSPTSKSSTTPAPTSTVPGSDSNTGSLPIVALIICLAFAAVGLLAVQAQRRSNQS